MKTRNLLITIGAAAFAAITINVTASDALLSPRAPGGTGAANLASPSTATISPRAAGNQIVTVAGQSNDVNPATQCSRNMTGSSPKAIQACAANPAGMACCAAATTK